jgi:hypothetical protein
MGGLGNQLFQIFTVISYSIEYKHNFKFLNIKNANPIRTTYWNTLFNDVSKMLLASSLPPAVVIKEPNFHFTPISSQLLTDYDNICLDGYYQSYKYFDKYFTSIVKMLKLDKSRENIQNKFQESIEFNKCISLHFRIGDYKRFQHVHPILSVDYYENALALIIERSSDVTLNKVIYFCEDQDIDEVSNKISYLNHRFPTLIFERCPSDLQDWEQMFLMSCCAHNIIANSSFSWWGAYLNLNPNKIVCYPSRWFAEGTIMDVRDLFPNEWYKLSIGPKGLHSTGSTGLHSTGSTGIHSTGSTGLDSTGSTGLHSTGPTGIHSTGPTGIHSTGPTGIHSTGSTGIHSTGTTGILEQSYHKNAAMNLEIKQGKSQKNIPQVKLNNNIL